VLRTGASTPKKFRQLTTLRDNFPKIPGIKKKSYISDVGGQIKIYNVLPGINYFKKFALVLSPKNLR
jgi:hypothetical protein